MSDDNAKDCALADVEEEKMVAELRSRLEPDINALKEQQLDFPHVVGDIILLRVLRGNKKNLDDAVKWYKEFLELRKKHGLDATQKAAQEAGLKWKATDMPNHELCLKYMNTIFDEETLRSPSGHLIWYDDLSQTRANEILSEVGWDKYMDFQRTSLELRCSTVDRLSRDEKRIVKITRIFDFDGYTMGDWNKELYKKDQESIQPILIGTSIEIVRRCFFVGMPWFVRAAFPVIQKTLPERLVSRFRVLGPNFLQESEFLREVGPEMIGKLLSTKQARSEDEDGLEGMFKTIMPGRIFERHILDVKKDQEISWEYVVGTPDYKMSRKGVMSGMAGEAGLLPTDIPFKVVLIWDDQDEENPNERLKEKVLYTEEKPADNQSGEVKGSCTVPQPGHVVFRWSNYYCWVSPKMLARYKITSGAGGDGGDKEEDFGF